ncbi:hypothetical protein CE195_11135 [Sodalis-like symbiont of Philaenus spumarius]|nr:hypothetical protein CE195_11135 [Sodalis-like symbiont of Philaenus spumarius]
METSNSGRISSQLFKGITTICFSRSVEIHEKVIGACIEKHMFY